MRRSQSATLWSGGGKDLADPFDQAIGPHVQACRVLFCHFHSGSH